MTKLRHRDFAGVLLKDLQSHKYCLEYLRMRLRKHKYIDEVQHKQLLKMALKNIATAHGVDL